LKRLKDSQVGIYGLRTPILWKDLRAFAAIELARRENGIHVAQATLRHKSPITTMKYYASVRSNDLRNATKKLGKVLYDEDPETENDAGWWERIEEASTT
jgi:integrase